MGVKSLAQASSLSSQEHLIMLFAESVDHNAYYKTKSAEKHTIIADMATCLSYIGGAVT